MNTRYPVTVNMTIKEVLEQLKQAQDPELIYKWAKAYCDIFQRTQFKAD